MSENQASNQISDPASNQDQRRYHLAEDATPKRIKVSTLSFSDPDARHEVDLVASKYGQSDWEVFLPDGTWIGSISSYTGSIDTKIKGTRLRREGKKRTLWMSTGTGQGDRGFGRQTSRAAAIRTLIDSHRRRA